MAHQFAALTFTDSVREVQRQQGSRALYRAMDEGADTHFVLTDVEAGFIAARDSFYMASVSETGWPYLQHRGGPPGFVRIIDERTLGFADYRGNRQYISVGNLRQDDRVALFFMDYAARTRLKVLGRARLVSQDEPGLLARLESSGYRAAVERGVVIRVEAFDWNCPQHITPRYSEAEFAGRQSRAAAQRREPSAPRAQPEPLPAVIGDGPLELVITGVRQLTPRVRAYELRDPQGRELPAVEAGTHVEVPVVTAEGQASTRRYSIASDPADRHAYEIAVLREEAGGGGSVAIHRTFGLGQRLRCGLPRNDFPLHADARPAVLIAGGIGITPIKAMAHALRARGTATTLHYVARHRLEAAYHGELALAFADVLQFHASSDGDRVDIGALLAGAPADALFYVCGPHRLVDAVFGSARELGIAAGRIRVERFSASIAPGARPFEVVLARSGMTVQVTRDQTLLDAALAAGVDASHGCRAGNCKACAVEVLEGEPEHRDSVLSLAERDRQRLMCPCVSRAQGSRLVLDL